MHINPHIFREFSIRGIADRDLTDQVVVRIGEAVGAFFRQRAYHSLLVGHDVRLSSERINHALIRGLLRTGLDVIKIGQVPTPVLNFSTDFLNADGGIMITASHNPPDYNGFKIRTDHTLQGDEIRQIAHMARANDDLSTEQGTARSIDPYPDYLLRLKSHAIQHTTSPAGPLPIVVDGGNGTNGPLVAALLSDLGYQVTELFCEPDGRFPNRNPDPTSEGAVQALADAVLSKQAVIGLAYDGDGDRLVAVDDLGRTILGDQLLMLLARDKLREGPARVVYEILCTQALADDVGVHGGTPIMTPSGYAFIHQSLKETGAALGGELSGHFFFNEPHFHFDDALLATVKLLNILGQDDRPLSQLASSLPSYASSPELRIKCPDAAKAVVVDRIRSYYRNKYPVEEIDGARIHFPNGWALVRQSNTQPVMSMRFEAHDSAQLRTIQEEVQLLVEQTINDIESRTV